MAESRTPGATYFFLPASGLLVSGYWGRTTPADTKRMREARAADPCLPDVRAHLIDLSLLVGTTATAKAEADIFRVLAARYGKIFGPIPTAIHARAPHIFGLARIFQTTSDLQNPPIPVKVVSAWKEAERLLNIDIMPARQELLRRQELKDGEP